MKKLFTSIITMMVLTVSIKIGVYSFDNNDDFKKIFSDSDIREEYFYDVLDIVKDEAYLYKNELAGVKDSILSIFADAEEVGKNSYYYDHLTEKEKRIYEKLYYHASRFNLNSFVLTLNESEDVYYKFMLDYPEFYWVNNNNSQVSRNEVFIASECSYDKEEVKKTYQEIVNKAEDIVKDILDYSDYEKVKYIYDYVIKHVVYISGSENNQDIRSSLLNGKSVCAGYSGMFKFLCDKASIDCLSVFGKTNPDRGIYHEWNCVKVDGNYYWVDVTWDDGHKTYKYFLKSDEDFFKTHTLVFDYGYPVCETNY